MGNTSVITNKKQDTWLKAIMEKKGTFNRAEIFRQGLKLLYDKECKS